MYEFIEASLFARYVHDYLSDEEYFALQWFLSINPTAGDLIPGSGGCRKLRWGAAGKGKRGGVRTIYYGPTTEGVIWLLAIYAKNRQKNLPAHIIKSMKDRLVQS